MSIVTLLKGGWLASHGILIAYRVGLIWVIKLAFLSSKKRIFDELIVEGLLKSLRYLLFNQYVLRLFTLWLS
jgi:hypothetical protein